MSLRNDLAHFISTSLLRGEDEVGPDDNLIERGIIDSIGLMQLMLFIEQHTGMRVPDHLVNPENFRSISMIENTLLQAHRP